MSFSSLVDFGEFFKIVSNSLEQSAEKSMNLDSAWEDDAFYDLVLWAKTWVGLLGCNRTEKDGNLLVFLVTLYFFFNLKDGW